MNYFSYLWALFIVMPLVELALLFKLHEIIGWGQTIGLVVITGYVGAMLVKKQGIQLQAEMQREMAAGQVPAAKMLDGVMILIAGAFLITPGVLTDVSGFLLLAPPVRQVVREWLSGAIGRKLKDGSVTIHRM